MKDIKLEEGYYGSNVHQLGGSYEEIEIIVTDEDGGMPIKGENFVIGFYKEEGAICIDQIFCENYTLENAQMQIKGFLKSELCKK